MGIEGLENDYYLSGNDIWVKVTSTDDRIPLRLELKVENTYTIKALPIFKMYPSPNEEIRFNASLPVRALQQNPEHTAINSNFGRFRLTFDLVYSDNTTEQVVREVYFIRGGVNKKGPRNWYLDSSAILVVGKWVEWSGVNSPGNPSRIQGNGIVEFAPSSGSSMVYNYFLPGNCNYKIVKFLNSLGGYQYFVFEYNETELSTKGLGTLPIVADELKFDTVRSLGIQETETITLKAKTPAEIQEVFLDLIKSIDIYIYEPSGTDIFEQWERVEIAGSNKGTLNSLSMTYQNEVTFKIPNYVNREL